MEELKKQILSGKIFIYPTDTIYGLGCNAEDETAVQKIRNIKKREEKPFSLIAPNLRWIEDNLILGYDIKQYLPGPYTLVLKKKNPEFLSHVSGESLGVRIPNNKFCDKLRETGIPFITTSVNLAGERPANKLSEISPEIVKKVDIVIDEGELSGKPSILIINGKEIERK
jgi:L-threonylcarbamoyladenylate synthase